MYYYKQKLAFTCKLFQKVQNVFRVTRRKTRCWFIEKHYCRFTYKFEGYVQPLSLSATYFLVQWTSNLYISYFIESKVFQNTINSADYLIFSKIIKTQFGVVIKILKYGKLFNQEIILRNISDQSFYFILFSVYANSINKNFSIIGIA